jgi:hypothetical protein
MAEMTTKSRSEDFHSTYVEERCEDVPRIGDDGEQDGH